MKLQQSSWSGCSDDRQIVEAVSKVESTAGEKYEIYFRRKDS
jgi:hypothetical protein